MAATAGIELLLTQRLQLVLGLTPLHAGLIVTAFAAGVSILGTILTAVYTNTIHLPATAPAQAAGSIDEARAAAGRLPAGQAHTLLAAAASAFNNGYTLALAITAIALAAGSAFTYRYLHRQPATSTEQARHPEPAQTGAL
jgi:DHA2 family multidrug resistance protein-like MFS transporter